MLTPITALVPHQLKLLQECEATIERGLQATIDVAIALMKIKAEKLYISDYKTFDDYCRARWRIGKVYAHYLIRAAKVTDNLKVHNCEQLPATESQARPLAQLPVDQQANAWQDAVDECKERGVPVTAAVVEEKANRYKAQAEPYRESEVQAEPEAEEAGRRPESSADLAAKIEVIDDVMLDKAEPIVGTPTAPTWVNRSPKGNFNVDTLRQLLDQTWTEWRGVDYNVKVNSRILPRDPQKLRDLQRESRNTRNAVNGFLDKVDREIKKRLPKNFATCGGDLPMADIDVHEPGEIDVEEN